MSYIPSKPIDVRVVLKHQKPFVAQNGKPGEDAKNCQIGIIEQGTKSGQATIVICLETQRLADRIKMN